jgi:hypothetical protein
MAEHTIPAQTEQPQAVQIQRRAWVRFRSEQGVTCFGEEQRTRWQGSIQDFSVGGISLLLPQRFEPETVLIVERAPNGDGPRLRLVQVVHATEQSNGCWLTGCVFAWPLNEQQLRDFIAD